MNYCRQVLSCAYTCSFMLSLYVLFKYYERCSTKHLVIAYNTTVRPQIGHSRLSYLREVLIIGTELTAGRILVFWIGGWLWEVILPYTFQFLVIVNFSNIVITIVHIFQCNKQTFQSQDIQPFLWLIWYIHCNIIAPTKLAEVFSILPIFDCKCSVTLLLHRKNV